MKKCPVCGGAVTERQTYCSMRCRKRAEHQRAKDRNGGKRPDYARPKHLGTCAQCGGNIVRASRGGDAKKFCSRECGYAYRAQHKKARYCVDCGAPVLSKKPDTKRCRPCSVKARAAAKLNEQQVKERGRLRSLRNHRIRKYGCEEPTLVCAECGAPFTVSLYESVRKYCSPKCSRKANNRSGKHAYHDFNRRGRHMTRQYGGAYEPVNRHKVFERDGYRCYLCGCDVHTWDGGLHDDLATADHVVALANGGDHTYDNIKTACWVCNVLKSDGQAVA